MNFNGISSTKFRLTGLATGLDTDQIIKDLMSVERVPLDKLNQRKQISEWKRDEYRGITNLLRGLKDEYFNSLKPGNFMLSESTFKKSTTTSTEGVSAVASSDAIAGVYKITVDKLASSATVSSGAAVTAPLTGAGVSNYNLAGQKIKLTVDGVTKEIILGNYTPDTDQIVTGPIDGLQKLVNSAFGLNKITVSYDAGKISFMSTSGTNQIAVSQGTDSSALTGLGFINGASNRINIYASLDAMKDKFSTPLTFESFTDDTGKNIEGISFSINGKTFSFDKSVSISNVMNTVNSDQTAGVTMAFNDITDKFTITAKQSGAGDNIIIDASQKGNFFGAAGSTGINTGAVASNGEDAQIRLGDDPTIITRSSNNFTINGVSYTLLKQSATQQTVTVNRDTEAVFNSIKGFVDKYNEVIEKINTELSEKYDRNYQPLTDAQKESMSEDDIKKWEVKATTGLLRSDPLLQSIVSSMRTALFDKVDGVSVNLTDIGITTGVYSTKGKLIIDETKLKEAINTRPDDVMNVFGSKSTTVTENIDLTSEQRAVRYKENGIAYRLFDIVEDNIRTYRDKDSKKGKLLEKAGIQGDLSEFKNTIYNELTDFDTKIYSLQQKLIDKETSYYNKYAALEKAISKMNSQSSWLSSQLGQSQ